MAMIKINEEASRGVAYYVNEKAFTYWKREFTSIVSAVNILGQKFESLGIGDFGKEIFDNLRSRKAAFLEELFEKEFDRQNVSPFLRITARESARPLIGPVISALEDIDTVIYKALDRTWSSQYDPLSLSLDLVAFSANKAVVSTDLESYIKEKYCSHYFNDDNQYEAFKKFEAARDAVNDALAFARTMSNVEYIRDILIEDNVTGELSLDPMRFYMTFN